MVNSSINSFTNDDIKHWCQFQQWRNLRLASYNLHLKWNSGRLLKWFRCNTYYRIISHFHSICAMFGKVCLQWIISEPTSGKLATHAFKGVSSCNHSFHKSKIWQEREKEKNFVLFSRKWLVILPILLYPIQYYYIYTRSKYKYA